MAEKDITEKILLSYADVFSEYLEQIDDEKLAVYHMNNLSPEIRSRFTSDIGFVADYLNEGNFGRRRQQKIVHLEALCDLMETPHRRYQIYRTGQTIS